METAHPDILQLFLHLFDEGRITDTKGKTVDARKAVFIMTANIGAASGKAVGFTGGGGDASDPRKEVEKVFGRELADRIDRVIPFHHLERTDMLEITQRQVRLIGERFHQQHGQTITVDDAALDWLCDRGCGQGSGVRALKRCIEEHVTQPLTRRIQDGMPAGQAGWNIGVSGDGLAFF